MGSTDKLKEIKNIRARTRWSLGDSKQYLRSIGYTFLLILSKWLETRDQHKDYVG